VRDVRVLFFGDSLVAGVGDPTGLGWVGRAVAASFRADLPVTAYNLGVRRDTSADVLDRWKQETVARLAPEAETRVVFSFGANDATIEQGLLRVSAEDTVANLDIALESAASLDLPAFVVGAPPVNDAQQRHRVLALAAPMRAIASSRGVPFVDVAQAVHAHDAWRREVACGDGAHPGRAGYAHLASLIVPAWLAWLSDPAGSGPPSSR